MKLFFDHEMCKNFVFLKKETPWKDLKYII